MRRRADAGTAFIRRMKGPWASALPGSVSSSTSSIASFLEPPRQRLSIDMRVGDVSDVLDEETKELDDERAGFVEFALEHLAANDDHGTGLDCNRARHAGRIVDQRHLAEDGTGRQSAERYLSRIGIEDDVDGAGLEDIGAIAFLSFRKDHAACREGLAV